jgi:hypothetical protein
MWRLLDVPARAANDRLAESIHGALAEYEEAVFLA